MIFLIFFCATTFFINYSVLGTKDVMFALFVLLYLIFFADMLDGTDGGFRNRKKVALLAVWAVLLCLFRFNGFAVIVLSLPFLLLKDKKSWKAVATVFAALVVFAGGFTFVLQPALGITAGYTGRNAPASMTIPLQQTARYVKNFGDEVTPEEKEAISGILDYDKIAETYKPTGVDPISKLYTLDASGEAQGAYLAAWREMFLKHPLTYVAATVNCYYGYTYFGTKYPGCYDFNYSTSIYKSVNKNCDGYFVFKNSSNEIIRHVRSLIVDYDAVFAVFPGVSLVMSSALYFWIFLLGVGYCIVRRNKRAVVMYLAILGLFAAAFLGPANGISYFRYIYPIAYCTPFVIGWHLSGDNLKR